MDGPHATQRPAAETAGSGLDVFLLDEDGPGSFVGSGGPAAPRLFGGQVAAQAFLAAARSLEAGSEHRIHSLHGYFLRPGRGGEPIRYAVRALKDGRNFSARDVVASQGGEAIFSAHLSFTRREDGIAHLEAAMPDAPDPAALAQEAEGGEEPAAPGSTGFALPEHTRFREGPVEVRTCDPEPDDGRPLPSRRRLWIRPRAPLPEDPLLHTAVIVWVSDRSLIRTGARPHGVSRGRRRGASLDHALWFHRDVHFDDWWLYVMESPVAHHARALIQGAMYRRDGSRVVSVAQEALIRR
jgi:acyl-CoA thioesterase II